uniref:Uncharacterized protein n=1 Tax=Peronospora matthiolae TaxID=2874970 RepID=A0AAV1TTP8_9STRA
MGTGILTNPELGQAASAPQLLRLFVGPVLIGVRTRPQWLTPSLTEMVSIQWLQNGVHRGKDRGSGPLLSRELFPVTLWLDLEISGRRMSLTCWCLRARDR